MPGWILRGENGSPIVLRLSPGSARTVGRTSLADFILEAALVSRVHCRLTADKSDQLIVEDLESTNGTMVNGKRIDRTILKTGDVLTIGRVQLRVERA
jgi:pSer/pThr/pTyr-binding forkhead associated (FHA) protein